MANTYIFNSVIEQKGTVKASSRNCAGFGIAEVGATAIFLIVAVMISLEFCFMIMAARINDSACRDAARAAAQAGDSQQDAQNAAAAAVAPYANMGIGFMTAPQVNVAYNGANATPSVVVQTSCTIKNPWQGISGQFASNISFSSQYAFPIVPNANNITNDTTLGGSSGNNNQNNQNNQNQSNNNNQSGS